MRYSVNGQYVTRVEARRVAYRGALKLGYDADEALAVFDRAESLEEDGEYARDELFVYHDGLELFPEMEDEEITLGGGCISAAKAKGVQT